MPFYPEMIITHIRSTSKGPIMNSDNPLITTATPPFLTGVGVCDILSISTIQGEALLCIVLLNYIS